MIGLPHVIAGDVPSDEHARIFEAYFRAHNLPAGTVRTTAAMNNAVDWWNGLPTICPGCDGKGPNCGNCARDWAEA